MRYHAGRPICATPLLLSHSPLSMSKSQESDLLLPAHEMGAQQPDTMLVPRDFYTSSRSRDHEPDQAQPVEKHSVGFRFGNDRPDDLAALLPPMASASATSSGRSTSELRSIILTPSAWVIKAWRAPADVVQLAQAASLPRLKEKARKQDHCDRAMAFASISTGKATTHHCFPDCMLPTPENFPIGLKYNSSLPAHAQHAADRRVTARRITFIFRASVRVTWVSRGIWFQFSLSDRGYFAENPL
jgi:hypothetical protein